MKLFAIPSASIWVLVLLVSSLPAQNRVFPLDSMHGLQPHNVDAEVVTYRGRRAVRVIDPAGKVTLNADKLVILTETDFQDGVIAVELAGMPRPGAPSLARGFVGLSFRVSPDASRFEAIYLRPLNARAEDQLQRNHAVQYISFPEFTWQRLRQETPGKYESYVDLVPGDWTQVRIEVRGSNARLYVQGGAQPCLVVNDLKLGSARGTIALRIGPWTEAYFTNLRISQ